MSDDDGAPPQHDEAPKETPRNETPRNETRETSALISTLVVVGATVLLLAALVPATFLQRLVAVLIALVLAVRVLAFIDAAQQRNYDRLRRRLESQVRLAVAETQAREREQTMNLLMQSFVVNVHGEAGSYGHGPPNLAISVSGERPADVQSQARQEAVRKLGTPAQR